MPDTREAILVEIMSILGAVQSGTGVLRNVTAISQDQRPVFVLVDGDEDADEADANRTGLAPRRVTMRPQVYAFVSEQDEVVGSVLNSLRALVVNAMLTDPTLAQLSLQNNGVSYEGASFIVESGRRIEGAIGLQFAIQYILRPDQLTV